MAQLQNISFEDQVSTLQKFVVGLTTSQTNSKTLLDVLDHARGIPDQFIPPTFIDLIATKFAVSKDSITTALIHAGGLPMTDFDTLVPRTGWLHDYIEYTRQTEPPTAFHFFAGITVLGATIARRIYFPRGSGDIFPNLCCVLVAPAGKCKKTTACNLAVDLFRRIGGNILADKITPEAIVESFQQQPTATGLIYAPEWSVFLGKQQYMEGLVPMLTALFDCPALWSSTTIMRGTTQLQNVALSHLAATTIDWMQTSITTDAFAGGFMSRLLFIVQKSTPRSFPLPPKKDTALAKKLTDGLLSLQHVTGEVKFTSEAEKWYIYWYNNRTSTLTDKHFAGYYERKPDRLIQLAMVMNAAESPKSLVIEESTLQAAHTILLWIERYLPATFEELSSSAIGDDQLRLLRQLRAHGELSYSSWLRMNTSRMSTDMFKKYLSTLREAKLITVDFTRHKYYILNAGRVIE